MAQTKDYAWNDEALEVLQRGFLRLTAAPPAGWANARSVRRVFGAAATAQGRRLGDDDPSATLTAKDAETALRRLYPQAV